MTKIKSPFKHDTNPPHSIVPYADHEKYHDNNPVEEEVVVEETPVEETEDEEFDLSEISVVNPEDYHNKIQRERMSIVDAKYKKLEQSGEYSEEQLDAAYVRLLDKHVYFDLKGSDEWKSNLYRGIIKEREDKRKKEKIKNKGAINVGFGSTPSDHIRSSQNPNTPTVALTEEDYIVKNSDGNYDYSTTVDEALQHNMAIDQAEGTDDPYGLQGGENHFQIVLKTHKKDNKTTDSDGSTLVKPVNVNSYADEIAEINNSNLSDEEKEIRIGYVVDRYEEFLDLDVYHKTKKELVPLYEEYEKLTGASYSGPVESFLKELKIERDKSSFTAYITSRETAQDMSGLYYSPNFGWMDKATAMYKFEEWITQDDVLETMQFGISEDMEVNFQVHGEQWMHDNMVLTPDQVEERRITATTRYKTNKALDDLDLISDDKDTHPSEITDILTGVNLSQYNLVVNSVDNSHYTTGDYVELYIPSLVGPLDFSENNPGVAWKKGDYILWRNKGTSRDDFREQLEMILKQLEKQRNDERGNVTLLNSLLRKSTKSGEKDLTFDKMLGLMDSHNIKMEQSVVNEYIDEGFNNFFEGSGLTLEYKGGGLRQLVLKRNGEEVKRFKYGWEVISYLASSDGVTKEEMNALYKNGLKYQNEKLVNPVQEYREKLERETSERDITDQQSVVKFLNNLGVDASNELDAPGLDPEDVRVPLSNLEDIAPEFANRRGHMASKSLKWWADKKANGYKMDFEDFYEDVWDFVGATRPYDLNIFYTRGAGESMDRRNAKKAWTWIQELDRQYEDEALGIKEQLYNKDYSEKITTFIQNRKDGKHQIAFMDFGVAMYDDGEGNITPATNKQIKEDIEERLDIMSELVVSNQTQVQNAMQDLADVGFVPGITVNEETGDIKFDQLLWEGEGEEPDIPQELVDKLHAAIKIYHDTREEISAEIEILGKQQIEMMGDDLTLDAIQSQEFMSTDYWENFWRRAGRGTDNVLLTIPALLGHDASIDQLQVNNKAAQYEKSYEWGEGDNWGAFGMVWADQGANMIYFVSTLGAGTAVGLGTKATMAIASTGIGLQSAGGKDVQLKTLYENAEDALLKLDALNEEYNKGFMTDETYLRNRRNIDDIIRAGDISPTQHAFSVLQTGVVEAGFTYGFGLLGAGRLNTARNLQKAFVNSKAGLQGTMSYNPYIATGNVIKGTVAGTTGEIAEESSIYLTTELIDSYLFDREGDYSQLSKVMIDAAVMSSSMNSMSLTANAVMSHNMRKETRDEFNAINQQINDIKGEMKNGVPTPGSIMDIDLQIKKAVGNPQEVTRLEKLREALNDEVMQLEKKNFINWQNFHIQVLGMNEADQKTIFENEKALNKYYVEAGVTSKTAADEAHVEKMLQLHKARLNKKKKGSGDEWYNKYHEIKKSNEELKGNFDMETAAKAIYGPNYKENGSRKEIQDRIKNDKTKKGKERAEEYDRADAENKLRLELEYIQQSFLENATSEMKDNDKVVNAVEGATGDTYYEVNGNTYETKKDFIDAVKKAKEGEGDVVIKVENDEQASILSNNIMSQNSNNDVTVEQNNYNSDGAKVITTDEEIEILEREATEEATGEKIEGEVDPSKRKVTILNDKRHQTEEQWENKHKNTKNYKYKRHQRDRKQKEIYNYLARTHYAGGKKGLQTFQEGKVNSKNLAEEVKKATGKDLVFDEVGSVDGLLNKINELAALPDGDPNRITSDQQMQLREQVENNRKQIEQNSNGFLLGNKFFVINEKQAKIRMKEDLDATGEGSFLQGAAWMHEMGHYLDNVTKTIEEISQKGIYLNEFLLKDKSKRAQILNEAVENDLRRMSDGNGFYLKNGETIADIINERKTTTNKKRLDRIDQILDEYIREVTTKMNHSAFAKLRKDITKRGRKTPFWKRSKKDDFKINNPQEAAFEVVSYLEDFKRGKISESYRVQIETAKTKKDLAADVRGGMQQSVAKGSETIEQAINNLVRNPDGSLMTKEEYDNLLDRGVQTKRRRDKKTKEWVITKQPHPANLLTSDPSLPGNDWLNGSIRNLGTRMEGGNISLVKGERDPMSDFIQAVKDKLTTAITNYNPETKYQGAAEGDLSGWLAQTIIYKKPGVIDDFRKLQETRAAAKEGGVYKRDELDVETIEGTVVFARKLGFKEEVIGQDENGNDITRNAFDLIVEKKFNEVIAQDPKTYKDTKSLVKDNDAVLIEILNIVAKEFGVKPSKLIKDSALTTDERTSIQLKINSIGARSMLNMMPEAFNSLGDANGVQPVFLDGKKGKAINSETGETNLIYTAQEGRVKTTKQRIGNKIVYGTSKKKGGGKGLRIQKKNFVDNINEADYLDMHGITPVGVERRFRTEDRVVDGPLRGSVMQVVIIIANQSVTKIAEEKGLIGLQSMKDGKGDLMFSSIIDASGQDLIQNMYWDYRSDFHKNLDKVVLNVDDGTKLKQQITKALEDTWPETTFGKNAWIGDDKVDYKGKLITWYSKVLRERYLKYREEAIVMEGQDIDSFMDFLVAEDSKRDDGFDSIAKILGTDPISKLYRERREKNKSYQRTNADSYIGKLQEEGLTEDQAREKAVGEYIRNKSFLENGTMNPTRAMTFGDPLTLIYSKEEHKGEHNQAYTEEFLSHIYPGLISYKKGPKVLNKKGEEVLDKVSYVLTVKKGNKTTEKTIEVTKAWPQATTVKMLATTNEDGSIDLPMTKEEANARKKDSDEAMKFYDDITAIAAETSKGMEKGGAEHFAMHVAAMNANMKTPLRRGAVFTYAALDAPAITLKDVNGKKNFEFEHGLPAKVVNALMIGRHWFNNGLTLEDIQKAYEVGVLHRDFNDNVGRLFKERMHFNYKVGDGALKRWLNQWTRSGSSHALYNVFTGKVEGQQQADNWKKIEASNKARTVDKAMQQSRVLNHETPRKGMSAWDFDDTLATTKSGVRATIPNPDGSPQPSRKVIFLAGGAGSGKSNVVSKLNLEENGFKIVNQDISLEWLKKNHGLPENMNDLTKEQRSTLGKLGHQARAIAKRKMMKFQGNAEGVVVDGTGGSMRAMESLVKEFKDKGYDVSMVFVETSLETALERNKARKERSLLDKIVIRNHEAVQANKKGFKDMFGKNFMQVKTDNLTQKDPMPKTLINKVNNFVNSYKKVRLDAEEFATQGAEILEQGGVFDFSEFNVVTEGAKGPMFKTAMDRAKKFGTKDTYVLTARPAESAGPIHEFLKSQGLNIPLENITGLGNSTGEAKALWIAEKVGEGYNDIYFADDALQNVQAVKNMLDQFDIKSDVQQAKIQFSKSIDRTMDVMLTDPSISKSKETIGLNNVKNVDELTSPGVYSNIQFSVKHRSEYENLISKHRPDLVKEGLVSSTVDRMFDFVDNLNVPVDKKRKYEKITTKWLATSNIKLNEDNYKVEQAVKLSEKYKEDIFSYSNPNQIIEKYAGKSKVKPTDPDTIELFVKDESKTNDQYGITEYVVEDTKEGQAVVREVVDTHFGPKSNPWCIIARKSEDKLLGREDVMDDAWQNWTVYDKSPKRIVFQNGKLLAFYANDRYWDRMDNPTDEPVVNIKKGRVTEKAELVPIGDGKYQEFVLETRTVSEDGNTVETLYNQRKEYDQIYEYAAGTKIIENRVNGQTVKETQYRPDGTIQRETSFKNGKAIETRTVFKGRTSSVNNGKDLDVIKNGDRIQHEITDGDVDYWFGEIHLKSQGVKGVDGITEIGFQTKKGFEIMDVMKRVDDKLRLDLVKVTKVDPKIKGLPSDIQFSSRLDIKFNEILESTTGIGSKKRFSAAQAKLKGNKGRYKGLVPASAQDFLGLLYNFLGKGKQGDADMAFFKKALIDPFARAINELNASRQSAANDYKNLTKQFPKVKKRLNKKVGETGFTNDQAVRVYLWNKAGFEVPGLSKRDLNTLDSYVKNDSELQAFADNVGLISKKQEGYSKPGEYWLVENIASDLMSDGAIGDARAEFLAEWKQNVDQIFSPENLNKIEAIYGSKFREALVDILTRMETGKNRPIGSNRLMNNYMNWVNNSVGAIMFFNIRSAVLQTISATNYINWTDNNPLKAAAAFANQPQFWKDFVYLFNSDYLKQRRSGNRRGVNEADLTAAIKGVGPAEQAKAVIRYLLKIGFLPTQIADSFAIASGGASFYRNRIKKYVKEGMTKSQAEEQAFLDFQETTEVAQQSARPDMISQQQANPLGRLILAFQNTPMQYGRIMNKAFRDIANGRGDTKTHMSKIIYYGGIQAIIFGALQSAIFAALGDDDEEEFDKKKERILNGMIDSWLSTFGYGGKAVSTIKRSVEEYLKQKDKGYNADHAYTIISLLGFSPPIGSKLRKIYSSIQTEKFNEGVFTKRGWTLDNPIWSAIGNTVEGITNIPLGRISQKLLNIDNATDSSNEWWQRVALVMGWNTWDLGIKDKDIQKVKEEIKKEKKIEAKKKQEIKKEEKKIEKEKEEEKIIKENQKKSKEDGICSAISRSGNRCKNKAESGGYCTIHVKVEQGTKEVQCKKIKSNKERCKMKTKAKSGYCYYHD